MKPTPKFRLPGNRPQHKQQTLRIDRPVLVIEDQRSLSQMVEAMLRDEWGCEVVVASNLHETEQVLKARSSEFVAAICDLNLPDAPYGEVIDLVTQYGVSAIAMTGAFGEELRNMVVKKGVVDYVLKEGVNSYEYAVQLVGRLHRNSRIKVLIVDDSLSARAVLKHMLEAQKLNVLIAVDGEKALEMLKLHPDIKLVLVDYNMPIMDGFEFTLQARKRLDKSHLAIIGLSADDGGNISAKFLKLGANDFASKPYSYEELTCRVTQNLEMLELVESIQNIANRDYLTGLYNRRFFFCEGNDIYAYAKDNNLNLFVAMMDVDFFKKVNDTHGHDCGDIVLKHIAALMIAQFSNNLVARLGGEEFVVLIVGEDEASAVEQLENFRQQVEQTVAHCGEVDIKFTVSIGCCHALLENLDAMLKIADEKLYIAKQSGRNRVVI